MLALARNPAAHSTWLTGITGIAGFVGELSDTIQRELLTRQDLPTRLVAALWRYHPMLTGPAVTHPNFGVEALPVSAWEYMSAARERFGPELVQDAIAAIPAMTALTLGTAFDTLEAVWQRPDPRHSEGAG